MPGSYYGGGGEDGYDPFDPFSGSPEYAINADEFVGGFYDPENADSPRRGVPPSPPTTPMTAVPNPVMDRFMRLAGVNPSQMTTRQKLSGVLKGALQGASQKNIAGGGPLDVIRAITGGMEGADADRLLQEKVQTGRKQSEMSNLGHILEQQRLEEDSASRRGYYAAQQAAQNARRASIEAQNENPYITYNTGHGVVVINKNNPLGDHKIIGGEQPKPNQYDSQYNAYLNMVSQQEASGVSRDEAENRASLWVYGKPLKPPPSTTSPKPLSDNDLLDKIATETDPREKGRYQAMWNQRLEGRKQAAALSNKGQQGGNKPNARDRVSQAYSVLTSRYGTLTEKNVQQFLDAVATDPAFANVRVDLDKYIRGLKDKMDARRDRKSSGKKSSLDKLDDVDI